MTTPTPIPHLDEPAQQLARIRRLERDLETERANVARERKANGELALLVHELRAEAKALTAEVEQLREADAGVAAFPHPEVTQEMAIAHMEAGGVIDSAVGLRKIEHGNVKAFKFGEWCHFCDTSDVRYNLSEKPGYYTLLPIDPQENGAAG